MLSPLKYRDKSISGVAWAPSLGRQKGCDKGEVAKQALTLEGNKGSKKG